MVCACVSASPCNFTHLLSNHQAHSSDQTMQCLRPSCNPTKISPKGYPRSLLVLSAFSWLGSFTTALKLYITIWPTTRISCCNMYMTDISQYPRPFLSFASHPFIPFSFLFLLLWFLICFIISFPFLAFVFSVFPFFLVSSFEFPFFIFFFSFFSFFSFLIFFCLAFLLFFLP